MSKEGANGSNIVINLILTLGFLALTLVGTTALWENWNSGGMHLRILMAGGEFFFFAMTIVSILQTCGSFGKKTSRQPSA